MASTSNREPEQRRGMILRLHLVRGSFSPPDHDDAGPSICMDAEVWSKLPEEVIWEVVLRLPAAKHFQLQVVSPKWRQVLTSVHFRSRLMAAAAAAPRKWEQQQQRVVACACVPQAERDARSSGRSSGRRSASKQVKVVDIDLRGFVPAWFWKSDSYSVVAAGDGLVCISNDSEVQHFRNTEEARWWEEEWAPCKPWTNQYCVVNPVTRTCTVLPKPPFQPQWWQALTASAVTISSEWKVASYDLTTGGSGGWVLAAPDFRPVPPTLEPSEPPSIVLCGGEAFRLFQGRVHALVNVPAAGPDGGRWADAAAPVAASSITLLDMQSTVRATGVVWVEDEFLLVHRGAVFFVASLRPAFGPSGPESRPEWPGVPLAVWRLARDRMEWEPVARLQEADVQRLTPGLTDLDDCAVTLRAVYGAGELMCCCIQVYPPDYSSAAGGTPATFLLAFNLEAGGGWELLHHDRAVYWKPGIPPGKLRGMLQAAVPTELRPDLYFFQTDAPIL